MKVISETLVDSFEMFNPMLNSRSEGPNNGYEFQDSSRFVNFLFLSDMRMFLKSIM